MTNKTSINSYNNVSFSYIKNSKVSVGNKTFARRTSRSYPIEYLDVVASIKPTQRKQN